MSTKFIDVREYPEFASGHIADSVLVPLGTLVHTSRAWDKADRLTFVCKSGRRAEQARQWLEAEGFSSLAVLDGGIDAWRADGKPLKIAERKPWAIERQVRIMAGTLVLLTLALGFFLTPWVFLATAVVGAGLVFAGISDTCMMGSLLAKLPWNRPNRVAA
jgi:rhodanese-related sulfurtransferase